MDEQTFREYLAQGETAETDFKGPIAFDAEHEPAIAEDIIAIANSGGGRLFIGVDDKTHEPMGLTPEQARSFDRTNVGDFLNGKVEPEPQFSSGLFPFEGKTIGHIEVLAFTDSPHVLADQLQFRDPNRTKRPGDILVRRSSAQTVRIQSADDMRAFMQRALAARSEYLLSQMRQLLTGAPPAKPAEDPAEIFQRSLGDWAKDDVTTANPACAWWQFRIVPVPIPRQADAGETLRRLKASKSQHGGWRAFPSHTDCAPCKTVEVLSALVRGRLGGEETWSAGFDGCFGYRAVVAGDTVEPQASTLWSVPPPQRILDWRYMVHLLTGFFEFASKYAAVLEAESLWIELRLANIEGRTLGEFDGWAIERIQNYTAAESAWAPRATLHGSADLATGWKASAARALAGLLSVFQKLDADSLISEAQDRFLSGRP